MTTHRTALFAVLFFLAGCADRPGDALVAGGDVADNAKTIRSHSDTMPNDNPLLAPFETPFGTPPFDAIDVGHYMPAFNAAMAEQAALIDAIASNPEPPTFENTIEAMEYSRDTLTRVSNVFSPLNSANSDDEMRAVARQIGPLMSRHNDNIRLNEALFNRVKSVYEGTDSKALGPDQTQLLKDTYDTFVRGGANLNNDDKNTLRDINQQLSTLSIEFGENVLKQTNRFKLVIEDPAQLAGLPPGVIAAAAEAAGEDDKWAFTLNRASIEPFLEYSTNRELREKIYRGYINKANNGDDLDNKKILSKIAALRARRAQLLGFESHAHFVLDNNMAKTPANVYELINELWPAALNKAREEVAQMQAIIDADGGDFELAAWDWRYYSAKVRKAKYDLDEDELRPYFRLNDVIQGAFLVANKLYGITFKERTDLPIYHPDVRTYEVHEADGKLIGIYYTDWYPRAGKRGGAWMNSFRKQSVDMNGERILPIITNVGNFTKPTAGQPSLLRFSEVNTLFHEFGHALHGLLSDGYYNSLTGTSVTRDFVEFPSQVMENWASSPAVLKMYAKHYKTGEPIPDSLIDKIERSAQFNQGFETTEYLAAAMLDLDWHTLRDDRERDADAFEAKSLAKMALIPQIDPRYRSTYFSHIFSGGYSSGYYSYIWSEVMDADAFSAFEESGDLFDPQLAKRFRSEILARGGAADGMTLYINFRGAEPSTSALIERRGLK